jgi:hypothetical protein
MAQKKQWFNTIYDKSNIFWDICRVLVSLWLLLFPIFLYATQPKEFVLDGLKKLEQRNYKCVELRGEYIE